MKFKPFQMKYLLLFVILGLVFSFGIHAIEVDHHHPYYIFGEDLDAAMHINDKKWWLFLLLLVAITTITTIFWKQNSSLIRYSIALQKYSASSNRFLFDALLLCDPIRQALQKGILHPKIYG